MTVYVAEVIVEYEPGYIIGVYSSEDLARAALEEFRAKHHRGDDASITPYVIDGPPE